MAASCTAWHKMHVETCLHLERIESDLYRILHVTQRKLEIPLGHLIARVR